MTVRRVMGIETEYGVLAAGRAGGNPMLLSSHVVAAYTALTSAAAGHARWDYADEDPLADARGFRLDRGAAHPSLLTDDPAHAAPPGPDEGVTPADGRSWGTASLDRPDVEEYEDPGAATTVLTNGARLYVDHAHPEYSSPEVTNPRDAVLWDKAGERVMLASVRTLAANPAMPDVVLYKNNVDGKGASYGTHENYLVERSVPFEDLVDALTPFLVTRQVFAGAGRVGIGPTGEVPGFQLSQRADYIEAEVGLETTLRRPIVNTRDEPHADRKRWRRLHLILGDATLLEVATYLRLGTTSLVLWLVEQAQERPALLDFVPGVRLADPVDAVRRVSRDLTLSEPLELASGRTATALDIQRTYLTAVRTAVGRADADTAEVLARWDSVLERLADDPTSCAREVEWVAKLRLLEAMRSRDHIGWDNPRLAAMDIQWSDVRPERGLYHRLLAAGAVERLVDDEQAARAVHEPPDDTRAYFRGTVVRRFPGQVRAASWDSVVLDVPSHASLRRVPLRDPWRGTRAHVGALLEACPDADTLVQRLAGG
ncbi:depupylase/deamidase Dop [Actinotalea fermentans]|uniref:Proteasome accessory factor PafA2 n=1 Tax=Actinotalea fermentans TaxID=43671 RepID=A0A511YVA7_9CELL|nr:depupylase/deamidase Dop [Actinotalea fermentans]KGM16722.1 Pup deamidase/depupylase [Actinotalea fermentans ATCC 43279 = JCM 9966 = DSM 3133]GEN79086.1 proteasome accessory factor PafA2 [Actinotalea fermentans]